MIAAKHSPEVADEGQDHRTFFPEGIQAGYLPARGGQDLGRGELHYIDL